MNSINFFKKKNISIKTLYPNLKFKKDSIVKNIKPLSNATKYDLSFYDSKKYKDFASITKASFCITTANLAIDLPKNVELILVKNVLLELAKILKKIYISADVDLPDLTLKKPSKKFKKSVKFGNNVLVGKNVKIGKNTIIGSNTIIEHDVEIGNNCILGSNVIVKNSIIGNSVVLQDDCKIGQKGFGFIPNNNKNVKFPHIGRVIIEDDVRLQLVEESIEVQLMIQ